MHPASFLLTSKKSSGDFSIETSTSINEDLEIYRETKKLPEFKISKQLENSLQKECILESIKIIIDRQDYTSEDIESMKHYKEEYYDYEYFIPEHQILKQGHKIIEDGWDYWIDRVDYIFCYEDYMKDRNKVVTDLMNKIPFDKVYDYPVDDLIGQTDVWLGVNPEHASNGGKINGWSDVFSEKQEQHMQFVSVLPSQ